MDDEPVAELSEALLSTLEREAKELFGIEIPRASALSRLSRTGSTLRAEDLAALLGKAREQAATNEEDKRHFEQVVQKLTFPYDDAKRIPLSRIVKNHSWNSRRDLAGWVVSLDRFQDQLRKELEHSAFPHEFPWKTTGEQALTYIQDVWKRAQSSSPPSLDTVRKVLPLAYVYCLEDMEKNDSLAKLWDVALLDATVFDGQKKEWVHLDEPDIYLDDVDERRFVPKQTELRITPIEHLGDSPEHRNRTAQKLGLIRLSSILTIEWDEGNEQPANDWQSRFDDICQLLRQVKENAGAEKEGETDSEPWTGWRFRRVERLNLRVRLKDESPENVPVHARLNGRILTVAGRPALFGSDAAKELSRKFPLRWSGDLKLDVAGMLTGIDDAGSFACAVEKFCRNSSLDLPATFHADSDNKETPGSEDAPILTQPEENSESQMEKQEVVGEMVHEDHSPVSPKETNQTPSDRDPTASISSAATDTSPQHHTPSYTRNRALAQQNALADQLKLKNSLKGEIAPPDDVDDAGRAEDGREGSDGPLGDEEYRRVAAQYEQDSGRIPEYGDANQEGWDLRSEDRETGIVRLIEVKGKRRRWDGDEVVELSRKQVRTAFETPGGRWYLYVVEKMQDGYRVLPIENPVDVAGKWRLTGKAWREIAEEPRRITIDSTEEDA